LAPSGGGGSEASLAMPTKKAVPALPVRPLNPRSKAH
jgi:hypothetical protein